MANLDHVKLMCRGVSAWNRYRAEKNIIPDLTHLDIRCTDLTGAQLQGANFDGSKLTNVDLRGANLAGARLNGMNVSHVLFQGANLKSAEFKGADFTRVSFQNAVLDEMVSFELKIRHCDLQRSGLHAANLRLSHIYNSDLRGAAFDAAKFDHVVFKRILIQGKRLAELEDAGCVIELANMPTRSEWIDWDHYDIRANAQDIGTIVHDGRTYWVGEGRWDFFISHATCDKESIALPLARALEEREQRVWYDEFQIKPNDNLADFIKFGIDGSLFGVIIVSPDFFGRRWTEAELNALENKRVFLVLHGVAAESLQALRPTLADRYSVPASLGSDRVAEKLLEAVRRAPRQN